MHHFKVFLFHALVSWLWGMWDLSSPTKDRTCTPCIVSEVLTTGPPGKSQRLWLLITFSSLRSQLHSKSLWKILEEIGNAVLTPLSGVTVNSFPCLFLSSFNSFPATMLVVLVLVLGHREKWKVVPSRYTVSSCFFSPLFTCFFCLLTQNPKSSRQSWPG